MRSAVVGKFKFVFILGICIFSLEFLHYHAAASQIKKILEP